MAKKKTTNRTRRGNNEGSIVQRKDGRWVGVATIGYDDDGKMIRKSVYGKTRMEAANKLTELTSRIEANNYDYVQQNTFGALMTEWLLIFKKNQVSPRTFEGVFRNFELHIKPKVSNMKLDEVNSIVIQKVLNGMLEKGYSLAVVKKIKFIFNQFFEYCIENNMVAVNPTTRTRVRSNERKIYDGENKYKAIPIEIRDKFLLALNEHKFLKPLCMCMLFAGLRTGEVLALQWQNINFSNKTLKVERGMTNVPKFDENGKIIDRVTVISETKTAGSVREVPMPDILVEALKEFKIEQELNGETHNTNLTSDTALVFGNDDGSIRTYSGTKKIFYTFLRKHKLDKYNIHFHGLRHTYSNMLFEANQNPKVIQALLGHKSVKTTITTYNSVDKSYFKHATDILNKQFNSEIIKKQAEEKTKKQKFTELLDEIEDKELNALIKLLEAKKAKIKDDFEM